MPFFFALSLQNLEDQVLFAQSAGACDVEAARELTQLGNVVLFQLSNGHEILEW